MTMQLCFTRGIIVTFRFRFIDNTSFRVFYWLRDLGSIWLLYFIQQHLVCAITEDAQVSRHRGPCLSINGFVHGKYKCVFINSLITPKKIQHNFIITFHCGLGGSMSQVVGLPYTSYKPITNTAWVHARLCKLQFLAHGRWFSSGTPPLKVVAMIQLKYC